LFDAVVSHSLRPVLEIFESFRVWFVLGMFQHSVASDFHRVASYLQALFHRAGIQVVIFPAPTEKDVGESVYQLEVHLGERRDTAEDGVIGQLVIHSVDGGAHVARICRT